MNRRELLAAGASLTAYSLLDEAAAASTAPADIRVPIRVRVTDPAGGWRVLNQKSLIDPKKTAVILCDVWDQHWCKSATRRCGILAKKINTVVETARAKGLFIIHAPSETMPFYADTPQRKRMMAAAKSAPPPPPTISEPPLPIDDSDGGCDDQPQCKNFQAWKRQDPSIRIADDDGISDYGQEVYNALSERGITNLIVMGVHTNMCVLGRSFAIRQMTKWGIRCILVRDCTDTMYNPRKSPFVPHEKGTELVVEHIEKYLAPSTTSAELMKALGS